MKYLPINTADKWLIGIVAVLALCGVALQFLLFPLTNEVTAEVRVDGRLVKTLQLRSGYHEEFRLGGQTEYNIIEADNGRIRIRQDDSPHQIAVQTGWISRPPQQLVCLPYRVVITLSSSAPADVDIITN